MRHKDTDEMVETIERLRVERDAAARERDTLAGQADIIRDLTAERDRLAEAAEADAARWRAAEAEGHVVDFTRTGFGLQHPPSCRPDLLGCRFNRWLSSRSSPARKPGRYRMTWDGDAPRFAVLNPEADHG
jgi:hypothetical protein